MVAVESDERCGHRSLFDSQNSALFPKMGYQSTKEVPDLRGKVK